MITPKDHPIPCRDQPHSHGVAEAEAKEQLNASYRRFIGESKPARKDEAGRELIRAIFGKYAIAADSRL